MLALSSTHIQSSIFAADADLNNQLPKKFALVRWQQSFAALPQDV
jgi:hypothetical protein